MLPSKGSTKVRMVIQHVLACLVTHLNDFFLVKLLVYLCVFSLSNRMLPSKGSTKVRMVIQHVFSVSCKNSSISKIVQQPDSFC